MVEGERLCLCGEFAKAAHSFSNALHLQSGDKNCLVARSKCFLKMGELEKSLEDAEASLQGDPTFCKVTVGVGGLLLAFLTAATCSSL